MSWNYRLVRTKFENEPDGTVWYKYEIHEVYYDDNWKEEAMTVNPIGPYEERVVTHEREEDIKANIIKQLKDMIKDVENYGIFEPPKEWLKE